MYCEKCGKDVVGDNKLCDECRNSGKENKGFLYASVGLSVLSIILPFLSWIEVPIVAGLYSMFGMSQEPTRFSLFGYLFAGSNYQSDSVLYIMMIIALVAVVGIVFNAINVAKSLKNKGNMYKYGTIGATILNIMAILFILIVGLMSLILKVIELTAVPYIMLITSIANIILIKKIKRKTI